MDISKFLEDMTPASKKEFLGNLVISILSDLNETEKKELLCTAVIGQKESRQLSSMVEY